MENSSYALVLTGSVLPGHSPETVWPALATYFRMAPEKFTGQLLARAPLTIKQGDDLGKLQTLQAGIAAIGAEAEVCAPDGRPALFVLLDNAPRGPVPRVLVDERVEHGLWPTSLSVAEVGTQAWKPYHEFDVRPVDTLPAPDPELDLDKPFHAGDVKATIVRAAPVVEASVDEPAVLPPGAAIHAGFWRRCAAYVIDYAITFVLAWVAGLVAGVGMGVALNAVGALVAPLVGAGIGLIVGWLYFALQESSAAQATLGKRAMDLKVTDDYGQRIGFGRASGRFFGKILSGLILLIGFMLAGWTARKQALHDMLAGTVVVFRGVRPGQPLPQVRSPMPWYGWLLNSVPVLVFVLGILAGISVPAYQDYTVRAKVAQAMAAADVAKSEVVRFHASAGRCPQSAAEAGIADSVSPYVGSIAIKPDCRITMVLKGTGAVPAPVRGERIELAAQPGASGALQWSCSGTMASRYLPPGCRD